jgi:hypothetical protein
MLNTSLDDWQNWRICNDLHRMFVLQWQELLDPQTPHSWQARTVNFREIIREIIRAVDTCQFRLDYRHNIPILLAEAEHAISKDPVATSHFPTLRDVLLKGSHSADREYTLIILTELRRRCQTVLGHTASYHDVLVEELRKLLRYSDPKQKKRLYDLTQALATEWGIRGYSTTYLLEGCSVLTDTSTKWFSDRFEKFVARCDGRIKQYVCRFSLVLPTGLNAESITLPGLKFVERPMGPLSKSQKKFYGDSPTDGEAYVDMEIKALDPIIAK